MVPAAPPADGRCPDGGCRPADGPGYVVQRRLCSRRRFGCFLTLELVGVFMAELVAGRLVFYQTEGGTTYLRDSGVLASGVATETVFELLDPERNFSSAGFSYTWDLGNGYGAVLWLPSAPSRAYCCLWCREVIRGTEPVVRYRYSESGNYTLRLNVGGDPPQLAPAGVYAQEVQVLGLFNFWCMLVLEAQILTEDPVTGKMGLCILLEHFQQLAQDVSISTLAVFMGVRVKGGEALSVSLVFVKGV